MAVDVETHGLTRRNCFAAIALHRDADVGIEHILERRHKGGGLHFRRIDHLYDARAQNQSRQGQSIKKYLAHGKNSFGLPLFLGRKTHFLFKPEIHILVTGFQT